MSELMRAMIDYITITPVVMGTLTFPMRAWLLRHPKSPLQCEFEDLL